MDFEKIWNDLTIEQKQDYASLLEITDPKEVINQKWNELVPIAKTLLKQLLLPRKKVYESIDKIELIKEYLYKARKVKTDNGINAIARKLYYLLIK